MDISSLIQTYGYVTIFVGTFLEGETILVLGGFAAHRGYLDIAAVVAAAFAGSLLGDQLFFFLGRRHGGWLLKRPPSWEPRIRRAQRLLEANPKLAILSFRFLYGLRTVVPFAIGSSRMPAPLFAFYNVCGAAAWAVAFGLGGYYFGDAFELLIEDVKRYELIVMGALALVGAALWGVRHLWRGGGRT